MDLRTLMKEHAYLRVAVQVDTTLSRAPEVYKCLQNALSGLNIKLFYTVSPTNCIDFKHARQYAAHCILYVGDVCVCNTDPNVSVYRVKLPSDLSLEGQSLEATKAESLVEIDDSDFEALAARRYCSVDKHRDFKRVALLFSDRLTDDEETCRKFLKKLCRDAGKVVIQIGMNPVTTVKLDNFSDGVDFFVWIGCPRLLLQFVQLNFSKASFKKIFSPYEFLMILGLKDYSPRFIFDLKTVFETEYTTRMRSDAEVALALSERGQLRITGDQTLIPLEARTYQGVQYLNEPTPEEEEEMPRLHQGRTGIASHYEEEPVTVD